MTEEDTMFDSSMKKKKKSKKKPFDLDAALGGGEEEKPTDMGDTEGMKDKGDEKSAGGDVDLDFTSDFMQLGKKKKKKKTTFDMAGFDEALPVTTDKNEDDAKEMESKGDDVPEFTSDTDLNFGGKKKKKKKIPTDDILVDDILGESEKTSNKDASSWGDTDRDYTYDELLSRVFDIMREKNPEMVAGEKKRFVMKPPQVMKAGTKKTAFSNFSDMCKMLHRQPKHLLAFLLSELGTSGSLDGSNQLIIKGRFQQKQIENVLRRYIKEYVTCHTCRSPDTILQRDTRLYFLQCETCGSRCSVASIKSGFQAVTGKRAALRAKTT